MERAEALTREECRTMATPIASHPRPASPSYAALRRRERAAFRELNRVFHSLQLLDRAGCDAEGYLRVGALYRAACDAHTAAVAACLAHLDGRPPTPPAGPAAGRLVDLSEYELLQRAARDQHAPSARGRLLALPYAAYEESIEGADALARLHECDLLDLQDDGREPF
jgi:hypothetical protein